MTQLIFLYKFEEQHEEFSCIIQQMFKSIHELLMTFLYKMYFVTFLFIWNISTYKKEIIIKSCFCFIDNI